MLSRCVRSETNDDRRSAPTRVILDFSRRGKRTDNAAIESFNGRFREECLNVPWFQSLEDAQQKIVAAFRTSITFTELSRASVPVNKLGRPDDDRRRLTAL